MNFWKKKKKEDINTEYMARKILIHYLQSWGQSVEEQRIVLNEAVAFVGIKAKFIQEDGKSGWEGKDQTQLESAAQFRKDIESCWPKGQWEWEHSAVCEVIQKYKGG